MLRLLRLLPQIGHAFTQAVVLAAFLSVHLLTPVTTCAEHAHQDLAAAHHHGQGAAPHRHTTAPVRVSFEFNTGLRHCELEAPNPHALLLLTLNQPILPGSGPLEHPEGAATLRLIGAAASAYSPALSVDPLPPPRGQA